jgi:hypothetical protein
MVGWLLLIGVPLMAGTWQHRGMRSPFYGAFTYTTLAIVLLSSGIVGADLLRAPDGFVRVQWTSGVVWWELKWGLAFLLPAAYLWHRALGSIKQG